MDNSKEFTVIEFCAGYAGISYGLARIIANLRVVAYSEIEAYCCTVLVDRVEQGLLDAAPIWTNIKTFPGKDFHGKVYLIAAGYPCQPFSGAGERKGQEDPRHLWPYIRRSIVTIRPGWTFLENVTGHITLGLSSVLADLEEDGYKATWVIFSAEEVGAPHRRERVFIIAKRGGARLPKIQHANWENKWPSSPRKKQYSWEPFRIMADTASVNGGTPAKKWKLRTEIGIGGENMADSNGERLQAIQQQSQQKTKTFAKFARTSTRKIKSKLGGGANGIANRVDRLRALGNGVVPQTAVKAFRYLYDNLRQRD